MASRYSSNGVKASSHNTSKIPSNCHSNGDSNIEKIKAMKRSIQEENGSTPSNSHTKIKRARWEDGEQFLKDLVEMMIQGLNDWTQNSESKLVEFHHPDELEKRMSLQISDSPCSNEKLLSMCKDVMRYSVKTGHPHFYNQLFGGFNPYGLGGAWLTDCLNASQYTYEVAPVFNIMEKEVLNKMMSYIGFPNGDAIFCPGGSMSNMYAINLSRYRKFPDVKESGLFGLPKLCILTSEKGHYSFKKGAAFLGIGMDNVLTVKTDNAGRMIPDELERMIVEARQQGIEPIMVNATAGSTVLGAYDPLMPIADICERHEIWMHVDGAWGGSALLSDKLRTKMNGIHRADSMTWNPHKMMNAPLQAAAFFCKHKNLMAEGHSANARYLFQQDKFYDVSYDTGDKSMQCGRKVDVLKLWTLWKSKGNIQMSQDIENVFHCAKYLHKKLEETDGFRMVLKEPECTNVCFWYIPPSLRGQEETPEWWAKVAKVAPEIKKRMTEQGTMMCGYQPDGPLVNFFRMVIANNDTRETDMDFVANEIVRLGHDL